MIPSVLRRHAQGFTLLEIMLVLVLTGLMLATVIPTLAPEDTAGQVNTVAEQLLIDCRKHQQQAMLNGQDLGLKLLDDGYQFLQFQKDRWQPLGNDPQPQAKGIHLKLEVGESVWQEMIWLEQQHGTRLESRAYQPEADDAGEVVAESSSESAEAAEEPLIPDVVFRAAGDITPGRLTLSAADQKQTLVFKETGQITLADGDNR